MKKMRALICGITSANKSCHMDAERDIAKANPPNVGGKEEPKGFQRRTMR